MLATGAQKALKVLGVAGAASRLQNNTAGLAMPSLFLMVLMLICLILGRKSVVPIGLAWASQLQTYSKN